MQNARMDGMGIVVTGANSMESLQQIEVLNGIGAAIYGPANPSGMFNFVPLLPLDGGHVAGALWEAIRRGWARITRRQDPGPFDIARLLPLTYVVGIALLGMGLLLIVADIVEPVRLF